jgi:cysteine-rich repeat protein
MLSQPVIMVRPTTFIWLPLLLIVLSPARTYAHGQPVQLAFWGGFPRNVARCQRVIAAAVARCARETVAARQACYDPVLAGHQCDTAMLNGEIVAIRQRARDMIPGLCSDSALRQLIFDNLFDAFMDIVDSCRRIDTAITSAVYAPALGGRAVPGRVEKEHEACITATGRAASRLLAYAMAERQRALDRIASTRLDPGRKQALVEHSRQRIVRARERLQNWITPLCPDPTFEAIYARDGAALLDNVTRQADCLAQYVYVQDTVVCPAPICGNGVQEPGEECDDGNDRDDDGCTGDCRRSEP